MRAQIEVPASLPVQTAIICAIEVAARQQPEIWALAKKSSEESIVAEEEQERLDGTLDIIRSMKEDIPVKKNLDY